jgi:hypothetical protein
MLRSFSHLGSPASMLMDTTMGKWSKKIPSVPIRNCLKFEHLSKKYTYLTATLPESLLNIQSPENLTTIAPTYDMSS